MYIFRNNTQTINSPIVGAQEVAGVCRRHTPELSQSILSRITLSHFRLIVAISQRTQKLLFEAKPQRTLLGKTHSSRVDSQTLVVTFVSEPLGSCLSFHVLHSFFCYNSLFCCDRIMISAANVGRSFHTAKKNPQNILATFIMYNSCFRNNDNYLARMPMR